MNLRWWREDGLIAASASFLLLCFCLVFFGLKGRAYDCACPILVGKGYSAISEDSMNSFTKSSLKSSHPRQLLSPQRVVFPVLGPSPYVGLPQPQSVVRRDHACM